MSFDLSSSHPFCKSLWVKSCPIFDLSMFLMVKGRTSVTLDAALNAVIANFQESFLLKKLVTDFKIYSCLHIWCKHIGCIGLALKSTFIDWGFFWFFLLINYNFSLIHQIVLNRNYRPMTAAILSSCSASNRSLNN